MLSSLRAPPKPSVVCGQPCFVYRLGDFVSGYLQRHHSGNLTADVCRKWPSSLGCCYLTRAHGKPHMHRLLCDEVARRSTNRSDLPAKDTVVVHLRLGDVLDWPYYREHRGCAPAHGCYYVHPVHAYRTARIPSSIRTAVIVADPWYRYRADIGNNVSMAYLRQVRDILEGRGLGVVVRAASADDDFVYASNAQYLVSAKGGGFSALLNACARRTGARVLVM